MDLESACLALTFVSLQDQTEDDQAPGERPVEGGSHFSHLQALQQIARNTSQSVQIQQETLSEVKKTQNGMDSMAVSTTRLACAGCCVSFLPHAHVSLHQVRRLSVPAGQHALSCRRDEPSGTYMFCFAGRLIVCRLHNSLASATFRNILLAGQCTNKEGRQDDFGTVDAAVYMQIAVNNHGSCYQLFLWRSIAVVTVAVSFVSFGNAL